MAALNDSVMRNGNTQVVAVTGAPTPTTNGFPCAGAFAIVEIFTTTNMHMVEGDTPVANNQNAVIPAGMLITKKIGVNSKLSFLKMAGQSDGTAYVTQQV